MPENCGRAVDNRFDEKDGVKLIDVVLVGDRAVKPAEAGGNARRQLRAAPRVRRKTGATASATARRSFYGSPIQPIRPRSAAGLR